MANRECPPSPEKVIVDPDLRLAQQLLPDRRHALFYCCTRQHERLIASHVDRLPKRFLVDLAVREPRQLRHAHDHRRNHEMRQPVLQVRVDVAVVACLTFDQEGDELRLALPLLAPEHDGFADRRMLQQRSLDFAELDAEAAQFDLTIAAPQELQCPVCPPADLVTGAIQAPAPPSAVGLSTNRSRVNSGDRDTRARARRLRYTAHRSRQPEQADATLSSTSAIVLAIGRPMVAGPSAVRSAHVAYTVVSVGPYRSNTFRADVPW